MASWPGPVEALVSCTTAGALQNILSVTVKRTQWEGDTLTSVSTGLKLVH